METATAGRRPGRHAIVIGASVSGMGAARALSNHYQSVTIVERDCFSDAAQRLESGQYGPGEALTPGRKGVPQGNHAHGLLSSGYKVLDQYFPALMDDLIASGASQLDITGDFLWYQFGCWKMRTDCGLRGVVASRPLLEHKVREQLLKLPNIQLLDNQEVVEPCFDSANGTITGVQLRPRSGGDVRTLVADLVVDASGRGSRSPRWLAKWGLPDVKEETVKIDIGYATAHFERRPGDAFGAMGALVAASPPTMARGGGIFGVEGNRWVVTLSGGLRDYPPIELEGFRKFARTLPGGIVHNVIKNRKPMTDILQYRFATNRRLRYEQMQEFPRGFLVLGDALCSFNPIYGQGMSVGLLECQALDECLHVGTENLAKRFFQKASVLVDNPWTIATGEDLKFPSVEGKRAFGSSWIHRYMERAHQAAASDPVVLRRFFEVANLLRAPTGMMTPSIAWRVLTRSSSKAVANPVAKV